MKSNATQESKTLFENELRTQLVHIQSNPVLLAKYLRCISIKEELLNYLTDDINFFVNHQWFKQQVTPWYEQIFTVSSIETKGSLSFLTHSGSQPVVFATFQFGGFQIISQWLNQWSNAQLSHQIILLDNFTKQKGIDVELFKKPFIINPHELINAFEQQAIIIPVFAQYLKDGKIEIFFANGFNARDSPNAPYFMHQVMELSYQFFEDYLRKAPEQWLLWESLGEFTQLPLQNQPKRNKWFWERKYYFNAQVYRIINVNHFLYLFNNQDFTYLYVSHSTAKLLQKWAAEGVTRKGIAQQLNESIYQELFRLKVLV